MAIKKKSGQAKQVKYVRQGVSLHKKVPAGKTGDKRTVVREKVDIGKNVVKITFEGKPKKILEAVSYDWNDDSRGFELVTVIRDGIDYEAFESVAVKTPLKDKDWAVILDTTLRTLVRYKKDNKTFAPKQTEKIIEIQQLMQYGEEVFGDRENFHDWLMSENISIGGMVPGDLLDTSVGLGIVKDELGRIEHGILA
ncbi:type II RES/Xre toxin-antitoxin system antitoxin [Spongiimicrobium sp. 2-473A-2-J]|uniref:type II RES/Xre toxin-antitoxin system antitoxin n=1 Tax=Eudoraea algarum TaxID=3417568 RepID=UPI003D35C5A1